MKHLLILGALALAYAQQQDGTSSTALRREDTSVPGGDTAVAGQERKPDQVQRRPGDERHQYTREYSVLGEDQGQNDDDDDDDTEEDTQDDANSQVAAKDHQDSKKASKQQGKTKSESGAATRDQKKNFLVLPTGDAITTEKGGKLVWANDKLVLQGIDAKQDSSGTETSSSSSKKKQHLKLQTKDGKPIMVSKSSTLLEAKPNTAVFIDPKTNQLIMHENKKESKLPNSAVLITEDPKNKGKFVPLVFSQTKTRAVIAEGKIAPPSQVPQAPTDAISKFQRASSLRKQKSAQTTTPQRSRPTVAAQQNTSGNDSDTMTTNQRERSTTTQTSNKEHKGDPGRASRSERQRVGTDRAPTAEEKYNPKREDIHSEDHSDIRHEEGPRGRHQGRERYEGRRDHGEDKADSEHRSGEESTSAGSSSSDRHKDKESGDKTTRGKQQKKDADKAEKRMAVLDQESGDSSGGTSKESLKETLKRKEEMFKAEIKAKEEKLKAELDMLKDKFKEQKKLLEKRIKEFTSDSQHNDRRRRRRLQDDDDEQTDTESPTTWDTMATAPAAGSAQAVHVPDPCELCERIRAGQQQQRGGTSGSSSSFWVDPNSSVLRGVYYPQSGSTSTSSSSFPQQQGQLYAPQMSGYSSQQFARWQQPTRSLDISMTTSEDTAGGGGFGQHKSIESVDSLKQEVAKLEKKAEKQKMKSEKLAKELSQEEVQMASRKMSMALKKFEIEHKMAELKMEAEKFCKENPQFNELGKAIHEVYKAKQKYEMLNAHIKMVEHKEDMEDVGGSLALPEEFGSNVNLKTLKKECKQAKKELKEAKKNLKKVKQEAEKKGLMQDPKFAEFKSFISKFKAVNKEKKQVNMELLAAAKKDKLQHGQQESRGPKSQAVQKYREAVLAEAKYRLEAKQLNLKLQMAQDKSTTSQFSGTMQEDKLTEKRIQEQQRQRESRPLRDQPQVGVSRRQVGQV